MQGETKFTKLEFTLANEEDKIIIPVFHSGKYPPPSLKLLLAGRNYVPKSGAVKGDQPATIQQVVSELATALQKFNVFPSLKPEPLSPKEASEQINAAPSSAAVSEQAMKDRPPPGPESNSKKLPKLSGHTLGWDDLSDYVTEEGRSVLRDAKVSPMVAMRLVEHLGYAEADDLQLIEKESLSSIEGIPPLQLQRLKKLVSFHQNAKKGSNPDSNTASSTSQPASPSKADPAPQQPGGSIATLSRALSKVLSIKASAPATPPPESAVPDASVTTANMKRTLRVVRGKDWKWDNQDGGVGKTGVILGSGSSAGWCRVKWEGSSENNYRIGSDSSYDLKYPMFAMGDCVKVRPDVKKPKKGWGSVTFESIGTVTRVSGSDIVVDFLPPSEAKGWEGHMTELQFEVATVSRPISVGDRVRVKASVKSPMHGWGSVDHESIGEVKR